MTQGHLLIVTPATLKIKSKLHTSALESHRMPITIPKVMNLIIVRDTRSKYKTQQSKLQMLQLRNFCSSSVTECTTFLCLDCFYSLCSVPLCRCPMTLAPVAFWDLLCTPGFTFKASCNCLSGSPYKKFPATCLASAAPLNSAWRSHQPLFMGQAVFSTFSAQALAPKLHFVVHFFFSHLLIMYFVILSSFSLLLQTYIKVITNNNRRVNIRLSWHFLHK